jgi:hypothetical protein
MKRIKQNLLKQISWTCKLKLSFTQHFNKSQVSKFNIGEAGRTTKDTFLNLTNKVWQELIDYDGPDQG